MILDPTYSDTTYPFLEEKSTTHRQYLKNSSKYSHRTDVVQRISLKPEDRSQMVKHPSPNQHRPISFARRTLRRLSTIIIVDIFLASLSYLHAIMYAFPSSSHWHLIPKNVEGTRFRDRAIDCDKGKACFT